MMVDEVRDQMNRLRGRLFQVVEAVGMPEKQESAAKGVIRSTTYDLQSDLESAIRGER